MLEVYGVASLCISWNNIAVQVVSLPALTHTSEKCRVSRSPYPNCSSVVVLSKNTTRDEVWCRTAGRCLCLFRACTATVAPTTVPRRRAVRRRHCHVASHTWTTSRHHQHICTLNTSPAFSILIDTAAVMSFDDSSRLESQTAWRREDDPAYADDPEFRSFTTDLSDKLFSLTSNVSRLSSQIGLLGTKRETERVRERVKDLIDETSTSFKDIGEGLKKVSQWPDLGPTQRFTQAKLNREFQATFSEFQALQRAAIDKQKASAAAAKAALEEQTGEDGAGTGQQQLQEQEQLRLANQDEVDFQESLIIERESEIRNIEQSVGELNELFRDVAHMVHEQGEQLDIIADNVEGVRADTRGADTELRTAARHQRNARSKACFLLIILAVVLTIVLLAVLS